jgi:outer membrane lipoprotein-sorting protein
MKRDKNIMRHLLSFAALAAAAVTPFAVTAPAPASAQASKSSDLDRVSRHLRGISTLKAQFVQTDRNRQELSGSLILKQPGKIRFQYQKDVPLLIVADGRALTMIDYEVRQVQRWPIKNSPLGALLDPNRDVKRYGKLIPTGNPNVISVEVKDPKRPEYGTITMVFRRNAAAPAGLEMAGWVALDSKNNRTTISLKGHRYNQPVADSAFKWKDPRRSRRPGR